jgi:glucosyl-dolichyl phosphate glucuronosyltransferase
VKVTVAICTWNRATLLEQTLAAMHNLRIPQNVDWEILVVNNNCTDDTDQVIARHAPCLPVRRVLETKQGLSNARNCAMAHATGDWIIWTDDDVLVSPEWLCAFAETAERYPHAAAIGGPILPWFPIAPDPVLCEAFPWIRQGFCGPTHGPDERELTPTEEIFGGNMAYQKRCVNGIVFDVNLGRNGAFRGVYEDNVYLQAVRATGGAAYWSPKMSLRHYVPPERLTLSYLRRVTKDVAEQDITMKGLNGLLSCTRVFGIPRWWLRRCIESYFTMIYYRLTKGRVASLRVQGEMWRLMGMIRGARKMHVGFGNTEKA